MPSALAASALMLVLVLLSMSVDAIELVRRQHRDRSASSTQCNVLVNHNITGADISSPTYVVSTQACCDACAANTGCVAAVFDNYLCSLKASVEIVEADGPTVVMQGTLQPPTPIPTTANPTPQPPTPVPTRPELQYYQFISCGDSSTCNLRDDFSCTMKVYQTNVCYGGGVQYECLEGGEGVRKKVYSNRDCSGTPHSSETLGLFDCGWTSAERYQEAQCLTMKQPRAGTSITGESGCMTDTCNVQCTGGYQATTGQCDGEGKVPYCYGGDRNFMTWTRYEHSNCTGNPLDMSGTLVNQCVRGTNALFYQNNCPP